MVIDDCTSFALGDVKGSFIPCDVKCLPGTRWSPSAVSSQPASVDHQTPWICLNSATRDLGLSEKGEQRVALSRRMLLRRTSPASLSLDNRCKVAQNTCNVGCIFKPSVALQTVGHAQNQMRSPARVQHGARSSLAARSPKSQGAFVSTAFEAVAFDTKDSCPRADYRSKLAAIRPRWRIASGLWTAVGR